MTKEEILDTRAENIGYSNSYNMFWLGNDPGVINQLVLASMQYYADQETESLRQQNAKLVEALKVAGRELLQFVPITEVKVLDQINQALQP